MSRTNPPGTQPGRIRAALGTDHGDQLIPVGRDKRPLHQGWQQPERVYSTRQLEQAPAIGLRLGLTGLVAIDFDSPAADPDSGERSLQSLTGRPSSDLPPSWSWSSGKPGRRQVALLVPEQWRERIRPKQVAALEFRWRGQQSVIAGHHPETGHYHWIAAPWDQPLATAPDWLLQAIAPPPPAAVQPLPPPPPGAGWSSTVACRYYLQWWPAEALLFQEWWATIVVMRRAGLPEAEAFAWTAASSKHRGGAEFRRQWTKADRSTAPYSVAWLGARTRAARERSRGR
jgi:hypothetical protein